MVGGEGIAPPMFTTRVLVLQTNAIATQTTRPLNLEGVYAALPSSYADTRLT